MSCPSRFCLFVQWSSRPSLRFAFSICSVVFLISTAPLALTQSADEVQLRQLASDFFDAFQKRDLARMMSLWSDEISDFGARKQGFARTFADNKFQLRSLVIRTVTVERDEAIVRVIGDMGAEDPRTGKPKDSFGIMNLYLYCSRVGDAWKIQRYVIAERKLASALVEANTDEERNRLLEAEKELITIRLYQWLDAEGIGAHSTGSYSRALHAFELSLRIARQINDRASVAHAHFRIGSLHRRYGAYTQALSHLQEALSIRKELGDKPLMCAVMQEIAIVQVNQGEYKLALAGFEEILQIGEESGDQGLVSDALGNIGNTHHQFGNHSTALEYHQKSLVLDELTLSTLEKESLTPSERSRYRRGIATTLMNIGNVHRSLGNNAQAIEYYERSLIIQTEEKNRRALADIFLNVAAVYYSQSDYLQALVNYQKSLDITTEFGDKKGIADALSGIGNVYFEQHNYPHALKQYTESLKISQDMRDKDGIRRNLNNIASALSAQGNYIEALEHYKKGLALAGETGKKGAGAETLFNIGYVHFVQKDYTRAREFYERSLETAQETGSKMVMANALAAISTIYFHDRNYEKSAEFAERADSLAKSAELPDVRVAALTTKGQVSLALNQYDLARQAFENAIATIEELRGGVVGDERQHQQFFEDKLAPFHYMVRLMVDQHKPVEALEYAERAKGRALLDALQRQDLNVSKAMTPAEQQEERKLNGRIVSLNSQITLESRRDKPNNDMLADLYSKRAGARVDYETFQLNLYGAHPELKGHRAQMLPITLEQAGKLIPNAGSAILEYVVTADDVYLFVLTREHRAAAPAGELAPAAVVKVYRLNVKEQDLEKNIARFEGRLSTRDSGIAQPARELFDVLFGPARAELKTKRHLIIVPDGALWRVPFQALQRAAGRFLVEDYAISYAPSITALHQMADLKLRRAKDSSGTPALMLVAFGDPDLGHAGPARRQAAMMNEKLTPLPEAERQVRMLQQIYGLAQSRIYTGAEATEERVRKESGASRILHLATHGVVDDKSPMYSYVVLSQSRVNENEDGLLEAREIVNLTLNCDLVVLAACNTAGGRISKGEGVIGLAWSFFVGGSPAIIVSQWAVESSSTTALMIEFHKTLKAATEDRKPGVGKAEALRIAALKLLRTPRYRHPFYWAPFVVVGDDRSPSTSVRRL